MWSGIVEIVFDRILEVTTANQILNKENSLEFTEEERYICPWTKFCRADIMNGMLNQNGIH